MKKLLALFFLTASICSATVVTAFKQLGPGINVNGGLMSDPGSAKAGDLYYNSSSNKYRIYNGSWGDLGGSGAAIGVPVSSGTGGSVLFVDASGNLAQYNIVSPTPFVFDNVAGEYLSIGDQDAVYQIGGTDVLSRDGSGNVYLGAVSPHPSGTQNTGAGVNSCNAVSTGVSNTCLGADSGLTVSTGSHNTFAGNMAGENTNGDSNNFFGDSAGVNNTGTGNVGMGGSSVENGSANYNTGVGFQALTSLSTGDLNTAIGVSSGPTIDTGTRNTVIGSNADVGTSGISNATAIGNSARVDASNSLVLGSGVNVGIDTIHSPTARLEIPAGTATAGSAPLKIDSGTVLTSPEAGTIENDGTNLFYTDDSPARQTLMFKPDQGSVCGWYDSVGVSLIVSCKGSNPNSSCPTGYTQKTTTGAKFCAAN